MNSSRSPPTMSGPAHGVELSRGQLIRMSDGAGFVPSPATSSEYPSGTFIVLLTVDVPVYSSSHRSDPAGFAAASSVAASSVAASGVGAGSAGASGAASGLWLGDALGVGVGLAVPVGAAAFVVSDEVLAS
jgi:hypothetical protein